MMVRLVLDAGTSFYLLPDGEGGRIGRMRGYFKFLKFLAFSIQNNPSPTICDGPPSPSWARVF